MTAGYRTIEKWLDNELRNWSRWCWLGEDPGPPVPHTCASIEKDYIRTHDENTSEGAGPAKPYEPSAKLVDSVWRSLPEIQRKVLRAEYPQRRQWEGSLSGHRAAARFVGIKYRDYMDNLVKACYKVRQAFLERDTA